MSLATAPGNQTSVLAGETPTAAPHRPALPLLMALMIGIAASVHLPVYAGRYAIAGLVCAALAIGCVRLAIIGRAFLLLSFVLLGIGWTQVRSDYFPADDLIHCAGSDPVLTQLEFRIAEPVTVREDPSPSNSFRSATVAQATRIGSGGIWTPCSGKLLLRISGDASHLRPGHILQGIGDLSQIGPPENPGVYDWQSHFAQQGIRLRFSIHEPRQMQLTGDQGEGLLWKSRRIVREGLAAGFQSSQQTDRATLQALLLGDSDELLEQTWADFRASGTAHHLSISGLHIAIVALVVLALTKCLRFSPRNTLLLTLLLVIFYATMTRPSPPIWRSVLLCIAIGVARLLARNTDPVQCLATGVFVMLMLNPLDLFNPGLQLSAGAVAGLMLFARPMAHWISSWENIHDRMARIISPPTGLRRFVQGLRNWSVEVLSAGIVAHLITLPLVAWHFGQINPWAIVCSIALTPFVAVALIAALFKTLLTLAIPSLAGPAAVVAASTSHLLRAVVGYMAHWPLAQYMLPPLPFWLLLGYALLVVLPLLPRLRQMRMVWLGPAAAFVAGFFLPVWAIIAAPADAGQLRLIIMSVGNGSSMLVQFPDGKAAMIDCGAMFQPDLYATTIEPVLRNQRVRHLDAVILTHEDMDHNSALQDLQAAYTPRIYRHLRADDELAAMSADKSYQLQVIGPPALSHLKGNDASAVVRLTYAGRSILFTGDIQDDGIAYLLLTRPEVRSDILIAPHHGSSVAATPQLLDAVAPTWVLCSSAHQPSARQRKFDGLCQHRQLLRTGEYGAITVGITSQGEISVTSFLHN